MPHEYDEPVVKAAAAGLALVGLILLAAGLATDVRLRSGAHEPRSTPAGQGYPPPTRASLSPTPTSPPDADGFLSPPSSLAVQEISLDSSPYHALLAGIQQALDNGDAAFIASHVDDLNGALSLFDIDAMDGGGGRALLDQAGAANLLEIFFAAGSAPLVQGYFDTPGSAGSRCLNVIVHGFEVPVPHPTEFDDDPHAPPVPELIESNAASWTMCDNGAGLWSWREWVFGGYYQILSRYADMPEVAAPYFVVRP